MRYLHEDTPYRITDVDILMTKHQEKLYKKVHQAQRSKLGAGVDPKTKQGKLNHATLRRICHAVLDPELDKFAKYRSSVRNVNTWYDTKDKDSGATIFHERTCGMPYAPAYGDRVRIGYYIAAPSAKLSLLAKMCHQVCRVERKKLLISTDWPVTL